MHSNFLLDEAYFILVCLHSGHPLPLNKLVGLASHSCPQILHLHKVFVLHPKYSPNTVIFGFIMFNSFIKS